jgi:hypothetical protein
MPFIGKHASRPPKMAISAPKATASCVRACVGGLGGDDVPDGLNRRSAAKPSFAKSVFAKSTSTFRDAARVAGRARAAACSTSTAPPTKEVDMALKASVDIWRYRADSASHLGEQGGGGSECRMV